MLQDIKKLVESNFNNVNKLILDEIATSRVQLISDVANHIISNGGKRIRPLCLLLAAGLCGSLNDKAEKLAVALEFIHTATLLHDDVVDDSQFRRGKHSSNSVFGNKASILVGDFIYSRSFELMVAVENLDVLKVLSKASNIMASGEVKQLAMINNVEMSKEDYLDIIYSKTAVLFEASCESVAILGNCNPNQIKAMKDYGRNLGMAFQLIDDALDYDTTNNLGKMAFADWSEGKLTMPIIHALDSYHKSWILDNLALDIDEETQFKLINVLSETDSVNHTKQLAMDCINSAIESISYNFDSTSSYFQGLTNLANFVGQRNY